MIIMIEGVCDLHVFLEYTLGNVRSIDRCHTKAKHAHFLCIIGRSPSGGRAIALTPRGVSIVAVLPSPRPRRPFAGIQFSRRSNLKFPLTIHHRWLFARPLCVLFDPPTHLQNGRWLLSQLRLHSPIYPIKHSFSIDAYKRGIHPTKKTKTTFEPDQSYWDVVVLRISFCLSKARHGLPRLHTLQAPQALHFALKPIVFLGHGLRARFLGHAYHTYIFCCRCGSNCRDMDLWGQLEDVSLPILGRTTMGCLWKGEETSKDALESHEPFYCY